MEALSIPSPSPILNSPSFQSAIRDRSVAASAKRSSTAKGSKAADKQKSEGVTKPKQSKSRNGCITCKAKRLKCDETKPSCQQCHRRSVQCGGYKKDFKWRSFGEESFTTKPQPSRRKPDDGKDGQFSPTGPPLPVPSSPSFASPSANFGRQATSPTMSESSTSTVGPELRGYQNVFTLQPSPPSDQSKPAGAYSQHAFPPPYAAWTKPSFAGLDSTQAATSIGLQRHDTERSSSDTMNTNIFDDSSTVQTATAASSSSGRSPQLRDLLSPGTDLNARPPDYVEFSPHQQSTICYQPSLQPFDQIPEEPEDDVEEIIRQPTSGAETWVMRLPSPSPSDSSDSSDGVKDKYNILWAQPPMQLGSVEQLVGRFHKQTCGILSIKDGPTENPWRTLIWPLAQDSPALYHAIASMTAFHTARELPQLRMKGVEHMRQSIESLAVGIRNMNTDTALATTLALAFSESWDQHISTGIQHLRGARQLVNQALAKPVSSCASAQDQARLRFLINTWVYMDVIARLTSLDNDEFQGFDTLQSMAYGTLLPSGELDPLMGCASTLFPIIGMVTNLIQRVRQGRRNTPDIIAEAVALKGQIEAWEAPVIDHVPEDPTSEIGHSVQTAEAYRWATLLFLHQAVPEVPSLTTVKLARHVLNRLACVPVTSRTIIIHIYPLLAAGCEADDAVTRQWVHDRWTTMSNRMWIGNIDRCLEVIKEVWTRRDEYLATSMGQAAAWRDSEWSSQPCGENSKRKMSDMSGLTDDMSSWSGGVDDQGRSVKRRMTVADLESSTTGFASLEGNGLSSSVMNFDDYEHQCTVRGRLHWIGVMQDWGWEVLLG
ncbi:MAG: hypothetical protein M1817_001206 [Caeruleum heppii]|nr:MAG: hypothetical protein M1817_001206 [Caeruleum heppii]